MTEKKNECKCIVAVRVRGTISAGKETRETLQLLRLTRNNYAVLMDDRPSFHGMLHKVQNYVTWGEISKEILHMLIKDRGRLIGDRKITEEYLKRIQCKSFEELADKVFHCSIEYWKLPGVQPVFKLHPPIKGFKGKIKTGYRAGGELGYRGEKINDLTKRMI